MEINMEINRYIIWAMTPEDTKVIMDILEPHCSMVVSITGVIVCVETDISAAEVRAYVDDEMEIAVVLITKPFIKKLMTTKFKEEERKNFTRFLELTKMPDTINEALDLISERGGVEFLTIREKYALDQLTKEAEEEKE